MSRLARHVHCDIREPPRPEEGVEAGRRGKRYPPSSARGPASEIHFESPLKSPTVTSLQETLATSSPNTR